MGNIRKHLFWSIAFPNPNYGFSSLNNKDTWLHVLLKCNKLIIHGLIVIRHNKAC